MRSLEYRVGVIAVAGQVGVAVCVVVVAHIVAGAAAVAWAVRGRGCVVSFRGVGIAGGHRFE